MTSLDYHNFFNEIINILLLIFIFKNVIVRKIIISLNKK